jgi:hypothetical protein
MSRCKRRQSPGTPFYEVILKTQSRKVLHSAGYQNFARPAKTAARAPIWIASPAVFRRIAAQCRERRKRARRNPSIAKPSGDPMYESFRRTGLFLFYRRKEHLELE